MFYFLSIYVSSVLILLKLHTTHVQELLQRGLDTNTLENSRDLVQMQMNALKGIAEEGKLHEGWPDRKQ